MNISIITDKIKGKCCHPPSLHWVAHLPFTGLKPIEVCSTWLVWYQTGYLPSHRKSHLLTSTKLYCFVTTIITFTNNNFIAITNKNKIIAISVITAKLHIVHCFDTVGWKSIQPAKHWVMRCRHGYLYGARYRWFAHVPADATATPSTSLASLKSRIVSSAFLVPAYPGCPGWLSRV